MRGASPGRNPRAASGLRVVADPMVQLRSHSRVLIGFAERPAGVRDSGLADSRTWGVRRLVFRIDFAETGGHQWRTESIERAKG